MDPGLSFSAVDLRYKTFAANGLVGVYDKLNRPVDKLRAAVSALTAAEADQDHYWELFLAGLQGSNLDIAYLLDIQMTDSELQQYLERYRNETEAIIRSEDRDRTVPELIRYELAVRHARREEYTEAAEIYEDLHATSRAQRMRQAAKLFAATRDTSTPETQLQALYDYGAFLTDHSDGIFFNNSLWHGIQSRALIPQSDERAYLTDVTRISGYPPEERSDINATERRFRDQQEENWRAYQILNDVVEHSDRTPLGRKAAAKAVQALRRISQERFGRAKEINAADIRLTNWLARNR